MTKDKEIILQVDLLNVSPKEEKRNLADVVNETCPQGDLNPGICEDDVCTSGKSDLTVVNETCPQGGLNPGFCEDDVCTNGKSDLTFTCNQPARTVKSTQKCHTSSKCSSAIKYLAYVSIIYSNVLGFGISGSLGILYIYLIREFNTTKSETAMITSTCSATLGIGGIFAGMLYRRIGVSWSLIVATTLCSIGLFTSNFAPNIWFLFFSLGILFGSGAAINNIVSFAALEKHFDQHVHILSIILTMCSPFGSLCVPFLLNILLNIYSWRGALFILSGFSLNMCFSGLLLNVDRKPKSQTKVVQHKLFDMEIFQNKLFLLLSTAASINTCCGSLVLLLIVDFWVEKDHPMIEGIALISFISISSLSSRLVFIVCNLLFNTTPFLILIFYTVCGISALFFIFAPMCNTFAPFVFLALFTGFSRGMLSTVRPMVFKKVVGVQAYPLAIGFTFTVYGICIIPAATIVGKITDLTQSYDFAFYLTGLFEMLMILLLASSHFLISYLRKKNHKLKLENFTSHNPTEMKPRSEDGSGLFHIL